MSIINTINRKYSFPRGTFYEAKLEEGSESIIIDNCVITRFKNGNHRICKIDFYEHHFGLSTKRYIIITTGSRLFDNQIISKLADGKIKYGNITEAWKNGNIRELIN
jgi:hypothetical protein